MDFYPRLTFLFLWNLARGHIPIQQPAFKSFPINIKSIENETIFLPCIVENLGESYIRWWKGDDLLSDSSVVTMLTPPGVTVMNDGLSIESVEPEDSGEYTCEMVRPKPWSSLKQTHKIQVLHPPKIFLNPTGGYLEVVLGDRVKMGCSAKGMPPPEVSWRTKGFLLPSNIRGTNKQILEFTAASPLMSGIYQCEASNGIGDAVHGNIVLRVLHKPEVSAEKPWIHSAPGVKTSLVCHILADPEARVEWLFNGDGMKLSPPKVNYKVRGSAHVLELKSVTASDFGNYTCKAVNRLGESAAFMQLSGAANPVVLKKVQGKSGEEFSLIWEVESISPIFDYKLLFRKSGTKDWASFIIPADASSSGPLHSKSYTFTGLDKLSGYDVKIFARNRFGWSNSSDIVSFGLVKASEEEDVTRRTVSVFESRNFAIGQRRDISLTFALCGVAVIFFQSIGDTC